MEALAQRDEARATKDMHKERQEEAWAEVARLRAFAERLLYVHEMRDEKTAGAILESVLRGEGEGEK
jgi:hypothetical protein